MNVQKYPPAGCVCGELFEIHNRTNRTQMVREMVGNIAKTTKAANRDFCDSDCYVQVKLTDVLYISLCKRHAKVMGLEIYDCPFR